MHIFMRIHLRSDFRVAKIEFKFTFKDRCIFVLYKMYTLHLCHSLLRMQRDANLYATEGAQWSSGD